jgi:hypothetical protein
MMPHYRSNSPVTLAILAGSASMAAAYCRSKKSAASERKHLLSREINLDTHIQDVIGVIEGRGSVRYRSRRSFLWRHGDQRRR